MVSKNKSTLFLLGILLGIVAYSQVMQWELLGFDNAEVFGHVWNHSWRLSDVPSSLFGTSKTVGTESFPLIDPIPTFLVSILTTCMSLSSAYNLLFLGSMVCFAIAMRQFEIVGDNANAASEISLVVLAMTSPIVWGSLNSGLTEDWGLFLPVLALMFTAHKRIVPAGLCVVLAAYWGLVLGWMSAILVSVFALIHRLSLRDLGRLWLIMGVGVLPLVGLHSERLSLEGHRSLSPPSRWEPMWALNPWHHTDVASLFWTGPIDFSQHIVRLHPGSLGIVGMIASLGCRDRKLWVLFLMSLGFAFGPEFYWMGHSTGISNPLHWGLSMVPGSALLNHHGRWMLMASICWIVIVVKGMSHVRLGTWMMPIIVLEWLFVTPLGFPLMGTPQIETSIVLKEVRKSSLPDNTRLLRIPVRGPEIVFQQALYEQTIHDQPIWMNPNRPNPSEWFDLSANSQWIETIAFTKELPKNACVPSTVGGVLVAEPFVANFIEHWGTPTAEDAQYAFWNTPPVCPS